MFITQTRLYRYASRAQNGTVTQIVPPAATARFAAVVPDVATAMSYVPTAQRPAADQWGGYGLVYDLRYAALVNPIGTRSGGTNHLILLYDLWRTDVERLVAPTAPLLRNSHEFGVDPGTPKAQLQALLLREIEGYITRAALAGWSGDQRDPAHVTLATEGDPTGLYDKVRDMKDVVRVVDTAATDPSPAPLYTSIPK